MMRRMNWIGKAGNKLTRDERGAVVLEYALLLMCVFMPLSLTVKPLTRAIYWFMRNVYFQMFMP
jgi:Flp pilus assembly pilin Flp